MRTTAFFTALLVLPATVFANQTTLSLKQYGTNATTVSLGSTGTQLNVDMWLTTTAADAPEGVAYVAARLCLYKADRVTPISGAVSTVTRTVAHTLGYGPFDILDTWDTGLGRSIAGELNPYSKSLGVTATGGYGTQTPGRNYAVPTAVYGLEDPNTGDIINYNFTTPWKLMKITLSFSSLPSGNCYLGFSPESCVVTTTGNGIYPAVLDTTLEGIVITPEPATLLLLVTAAPFIRRRSA